MGYWTIYFAIYGGGSVATPSIEPGCVTVENRTLNLLLVEDESPNRVGVANELVNRVDVENETCNA